MTDFVFNRTILDLCGGTGAWSKPYQDAGYDVVIVDPLAPGSLDVRLFQRPHRHVHGILAAPPCTHFSGSGARWWAEKGDEKLLEGLSVVDACLRIIFTTSPSWWALENPVGRLNRWIGSPSYIFDPCDFGGWIDGGGDHYTKRTCLWGDFTHPEKKPVEPTDGSKMHLMAPSEDRWRLRSETPAGFAKAFFSANL